jgi:hypothetical protein
MQAPGPHPSRLGSSTIILPVFTILGLNVGLGPYRPANHIDRLFNTPLLADGPSAVALALPPRLSSVSGSDSWNTQPPTSSTCKKP